VTEPTAAPEAPDTPPEAPPTPPAPPPAPAGPRLTMFELARLEEARRQAAEVDVSVRESAQTARSVARPSRLLPISAVIVAAAVVMRLYRPTQDVVGEARYAREVSVGAEVERTPLSLGSSAAFGKSGGVLVRVAMPGQEIEFPFATRVDAERVQYQWVRARDSSDAAGPRPITGETVVTPLQPGIYRLALVFRDAPDTRQILNDVSVAVLVPFAQKVGGVLNGYRIGSYPFERFRGEHPLGFIEVDARTVDLPISRHLKLADFVTHDDQQQWPKYAAVSPRLLDKLELVAAEVASIRGVADPVRIRVDVHSGFRTPLHNQSVEGSALNSRHQYGDAADVAIDADGDGRFTAFDSRIVAIAAEMVERRNPELTGGLGVYVSAKYRTPYVHIDARGKKARWWG
jgi:uncharacterized protein YcbK (DUF882 family)